MTAGSVGALLGTSLALGVGGLDPTPALIAVAALVAGASKRALALFGVVVMLGGALLGVVLSLTVAGRLAGLDWRGLVPTGRLGAVLSLVVGLALVAYAVLRVVRPWARPGRHKTHQLSSTALVTGGLVYVASLVVDPTFVAVTLLAGRADRPLDVVVMQVAWVVVAQLPFLLLVLGVRRVGRDRAAADFQRWWARLKPVVHQVVTAVLAAVGLLLVADASTWFATKEFLLRL